MNGKWIVVGTLLLALTAWGCGTNDTPEKAAAGSKPAVTAAVTAAQTTCPVMGGEINKDIYVDHGGKRICFCCGGCPGAFKKDPEKYLAKLHAEGVTLEDAPAGGHQH